ncbi:MAG: hypothetical protein R3E01_27645 [Pirellulaceae bacterium]
MESLQFGPQWAFADFAYSEYLEPQSIALDDGEPAISIRAHPRHPEQDRPLDQAE